MRLYRCKYSTNLIKFTQILDPKGPSPSAFPSIRDSGTYNRIIPATLVPVHTHDSLYSTAKGSILSAENCRSQVPKQFGFPSRLGEQWELSSCEARSAGPVRKA